MKKYLWILLLAVATAQARMHVDTPWTLEHWLAKDDINEVERGDADLCNLFYRETNDSLFCKTTVRADWTGDVDVRWDVTDKKRIDSAAFERRSFEHASVRAELPRRVGVGDCETHRLERCAVNQGRHHRRQRDCRRNRLRPRPLYSTGRICRQRRDGAPRESRIDLYRRVSRIRRDERF